MNCLRGIIADCVPPNPLEGETPHTRLPSMAALPSTGPTPIRRFTDCSCCFMYLLILSICIGYVIFNIGDSVEGFERPFDVDHRPCTDPFKYIYIPTMDIERTVCVTECPPEPGIQLSCRTNTYFRTCPSSAAGLVKNQQVFTCYRKDIQLPTSPLSQRIFNSIYRSKYSYIFPAIFAFLLSAFIIGTTFMLPGVMTYIYMLVFEVVMILASLLCFYRYLVGNSVIVDKYIPTTFVHPRMLLFFGIFFMIVIVISLWLILHWFKRSQMIFLVAVIRIARYCYCQSVLIIVSLLLSIVCLGTFIGSIWLYYFISSIGNINPGNYQPWNQFQKSASGKLVQILFIILALWTHGILVSLSHFVFESIGTLWYYSVNKSISFFGIIGSTIKMVFYHIGTIVNGSCYEYYSQTITNFINNNDLMLPPVFYQYLCCFHNCCCRYLFKYSFIETILNSTNFWESNIRFYQLRKRTSIYVPQLYLFGNFYSNTVRAYVVLLTVFMSYFLYTFLDPGFYFDMVNPIPAMTLSGLLAYQIATCWVDSAGFLGDVIVFNYCIQNLTRMQRFGLLDTPHCPIGVLNIITNCKPIII